MFNIKTYGQRLPAMASLIPWVALVAPGIILNKDGSLQRSVKFRGQDPASLTDPELVNLNARLNNAFKRLGSGWIVYIEAHRHSAKHYLETGAFPDPISLLIDTERREQFEKNDTHFDSHYYLTLQYLPPSEKKNQLNNLWINNKNQPSYEKHLAYFNSESDKLFSLLKDNLFELNYLNDKETLTYLHHTISTKNSTISPPEVPMYLDSLLSDTPLLGGTEAKLGEQYIKTLSILSLPGYTFPALLDQLNHLAINYRWVTRFIYLDKLDAEKQLKSYQRRWFAKRKTAFNLLQEVFTKQESRLQDNAAIEKAKDADQAQQILQNDQVSFGYYTATITVMSSDRQKAQEDLQKIETILHARGLVCIRETINSVEAWLSSIPGHAYANIRKPLIHTLNLLHLLPISALWSGPKKNKHLKAEALMQCYTGASTAFRMSQHVQDVAHQMILGPTGSGKSVLLNFIALQFMRYKNAQVIIFDKGESFLASTYGVGGQHYALAKQSDHISFQPLAKIDEEAERGWALDWLQGLLINENISISSEIKDKLWQALNALAATPVKQRTITGLCALLQDLSLRQALNHYTLNGAYGYLFDADCEIFNTEKSFPSQWQCFEMEALLNTPSIIAPTLDYLFHRLEKLFAGDPGLIILDEAWRFLDHPVFANKIRDWLKGLRKLNVGVTFATQSIEDALNSSIAPALLESCPSRILLPNARAFEPAVKSAYLKLGLNDKQISTIAQNRNKQQYYFQSSEGNRTFELYLAPLALAFCATSSTEDKLAIKNIISTHGREKFVEHYLDYKNLVWLKRFIKGALIDAI